MELQLKGIQRLTDNGQCFTAKDTVAFARELGFDVRTTPAYRPQSNGVAEAFVKTFKRDDVQLPFWFEDYNNNAPHKGLGMKSPREFLYKPRELQTRMGKLGLEIPQVRGLSFYPQSLEGSDCSNVLGGCVNQKSAGYYRKIVWL